MLFWVVFKIQKAVVYLFLLSAIFISSINGIGVPCLWSNGFEYLINPIRLFRNKYFPTIVSGYSIENLGLLSLMPAPAPIKKKLSLFFTVIKHQCHTHALPQRSPGSIRSQTMDVVIKQMDYYQKPGRRKFFFSPSNWYNSISPEHSPTFTWLLSSFLQIQIQLFEFKFHSLVVMKKYYPPSYPPPISIQRKPYPFLTVNNKNLVDVIWKPIHPLLE